MFSWIVCQVSAGGVLVAVRDSRYMQSQGTNKEGNNCNMIGLYISKRKKEKNKEKKIIIKK